MSDRLEMAGVIMSAAAFFAGLILGYLGMAVSNFLTYDFDQQASVRPGFRIRAWLAFAALVVSVASGACAFLSDWNNDMDLLLASVWLLGAAAVAGIACALLTRAGDLVMALTLEKLQRLEAVEATEFFRRHRARWLTAAKARLHLRQNRFRRSEGPDRRLRRAAGRGGRRSIAAIATS